MGACASKTAQSRVDKILADRKNSIISKQLQDEFDHENSVLKILLLGTGNSGKSTILKQFKLLHTEDGLGDLNEHKKVVSSNIIKGLVVLGQGVSDLDEVHAELSLKSVSTLNFLRKCDKDITIWDFVRISEAPCNEQLGELCKQFWADDAIQEVMGLEGKLPMLEVPILYFMTHISRIAEVGYTPTTDDILQARSRTRGVCAIEFELENIRCRMLDVGGQKNERKKWISHFDGVTAIMFLVSLAEYDKVLLEDNSTNRMHDAITVFKYIVECPFFADTNIILFLNKKDLFAQKLERKVDLRICFKDYKGALEYKCALDFIQAKFVNIFRKTKVSQNVNSMSSDIYPFPTMATNTENVRTVFNLSKHIIFKSNLASTGLL